MSGLTITILVIGTLFLLLMIVPRLIMGMKTARLKGKPAPTVHKASAPRIKSGKKTILYFYTPPCGACKMQEPIIQRVKKQFPDAIFKIDATRHQDAAAAYGVLGVPFLAFINNGMLVFAKAGVQSESAISGFLAS